MCHNVKNYAELHSPADLMRQRAARSRSPRDEKPGENRLGSASRALHEAGDSGAIGPV